MGERNTENVYDNVNHPPHYRAHPSGVEAIELCELLGFNLGNAVKYLFRAGHKGSAAEDVRKAAWYLNRAAAQLGDDVTDNPGAGRLACRVIQHEPAGTPLFLLLWLISQCSWMDSQLQLVAQQIQAQGGNQPDNAPPEGRHE